MSFSKILVALMLTSFGVSSWADASPDMNSPAQLAQFRQNLSQTAPDLAAGVQDLRHLDEFGGMYELDMSDGNILYIDAQGQNVLAGPLIRVQGHINLTQQRQEVLSRMNFSDLNLNLAIKEKRGDGSRKVAIFEDPDCPYCRQLEDNIRDVTDVTIYTFLYPLTMIHPDAQHKASLIWCAKDRAAAWSTWMRDKQLPSGDGSCATPFNDNLAFATQHHISGTPTTIFANGNRLTGSVDKATFEQHLNAH